MSDEEISNVTSQKVSKFSSGIAQLMRLDEIWKDTHRHVRTGRLEMWNWDLDRVWCELSADLEDGNEDGKKPDARIKKFEDINKEIASSKLNFGKYYQILMKKELFLRRLQNELGKGTSYEEGDDDYMDG